MATNDEKRRVAAELRESIPDGNFSKGKRGWGVLYLTLFGHYMPNQRSAMTYREVASRLADLIDPDTTSDTTKTVEDTTKAPKSSDATPSSRRNCGTEEALTSRVPQCDRDALLALADDLDYAGANGENVAYIDQTFHDAARRIREACGEAEHGR